MDRHKLAADSRTSYLAFRRVERQAALIERLYAARGGRLRTRDLAKQFLVSERTIARDIERLRDSGVPLLTQRGRGGGVCLPHRNSPAAVALDLPEIAALMSSLAILGPSVTPSAGSAMQKLAVALKAGGE